MRSPLRSALSLVSAEPQLKAALEHVTPGQGGECVRQGPPTLAATITGHHPRLSRGAHLQGGLGPCFHGLRVLGRDEHRQTLPAP